MRWAEQRQRSHRNAVGRPRQPGRRRPCRDREGPPSTGHHHCSGAVTSVDTRVVRQRCASSAGCGPRCRPTAPGRPTPSSTPHGGRRATPGSTASGRYWSQGPSAPCTSPAPSCGPAERDRPPRIARRTPPGDDRSARCGIAEARGRIVPCACGGSSGFGRGLGEAAGPSADHVPLDTAAQSSHRLVWADGSPPAPLPRRNWSPDGGDRRARLRPRLRAEGDRRLPDAPHAPVSARPDDEHTRSLEPDPGRSGCPHRSRH